MPTTTKEWRCRITCGEHTVDVWPGRFTPALSRQVRARLGVGPREAYADFVKSRYWENDQIAAVVLIGLAQAGKAVRLADADAHPIIAAWDELNGTVEFDLVGPDGDLAEIVAEAASAGPEAPPDPE